MIPNGTAGISRDGFSTLSGVFGTFGTVNGLRGFGIGLGLYIVISFFYHSGACNLL